MKEFNSKDKSQRKVINRRKFYSAPNLHMNELRVKGNNMHLVSPEDIRKYKKEIAMKIGEEKVKKPKPLKRLKNKKLNSKDVDKMLMEPTKITEEDKKIAEDYQWMIKRNIIKLMGAAKKRAQKDPTTGKKPDYTSKMAPIKVALQKTKSESANQSKRLSNTKFEEQKQPGRSRIPTASNLQKDNRKRELIVIQKSAGLPIPRQRPQTSSIVQHSDYIQSQGNAALILHPEVVTSSTKPSTRKSSIQKLKKLFKVFKSDTSAKPKPNAKLDIALSKEMTKQENLLKTPDNSKPLKQAKKSNKKPVPEVSSTIKLEKRKIKKKIQTENGPQVGAAKSVMESLPIKIKEKKAKKIASTVSTTK